MILLMDLRIKLLRGQEQALNRIIILFGGFVFSVSPIGKNGAIAIKQFSGQINYEDNFPVFHFKFPDNFGSTKE